jgi:hypothetical protein
MQHGDGEHGCACKFFIPRSGRYATKAYGSRRIYNGLTFLGLLFCYFPINHARAAGLSTMAVIKRIDFVGGFVSIIGLTLL